MTRIGDDQFSEFFQGKARDFLIRAIDLALEEDGPDLTANAVFAAEDRLDARIVAKEDVLVAGLPIASLVLARLDASDACRQDYPVPEGSLAPSGTVIARFNGPARILLKAERVILNFLCHLSGVANLTRRYASALEGSKTRLLDTRKTLPGLRYPEKYAVLVGGGLNHRRDLTEMLMLKDNHLDRAGGVPAAITALRKAYQSNAESIPPVEVECRSLKEVTQAVALRPSRIMLDNMDCEMLEKALALIPADIESEISGGVSLETLPALAKLNADYISVGRITHSAPAADFSMQLEMDQSS